MDELFLFHDHYYDHFFLFQNHNQQINILLLNKTKNEDHLYHILNIFLPKYKYLLIMLFYCKSTLKLILSNIETLGTYQYHLFFILCSSTLSIHNKIDEIAFSILRYRKEIKLIDTDDVLLKKRWKIICIYFSYTFHYLFYHYTMLMDLKQSIGQNW